MLTRDFSVGRVEAGRRVRWIHSGVADRGIFARAGWNSTRKLRTCANPAGNHSVVYLGFGNAALVGVGR